MFETSLLIGGKDVAAKDSKTFDRINPVTGEVATRAAAASVEDINKACDAAAEAFPAWSALGPQARRAHLLKAANVLRAKAADFSKVLVAECGATAGWGFFNCALAAGMLEEAAAMTTQVLGEVIPSDEPHTLAMGIRQPAGVVFGMAPWNAPVILGVRAIATPLACGNTVVLKASEMCPLTHKMIGDALVEAGLPDGVVNVISHAAEDAPKVVEAGIAHPAVRRVNFTGSTRVGRIIGELSARHFKPCVLELGGKAPMVIMDDADLDVAAGCATFGAFMNQGQICMSTERIILDNAIADDFLARFKTRTEGLSVGDPNTENVVIGAVVNQSTVDRCNELIDDAVAKGARLVTGTKGQTTVMAPVIVDGVTREMRIYSEESFGPVVSVIRSNGDEEALKLANDTEYGLSAAVFSRNIPRAMAMAQKIDSGICHINSPTVQDLAQMPFGGVKASGYGRFGGKWGVHEFTETRWLTIEMGERHLPI